ncbi:hypothetical protein A5320_03840 [Rheinheimera sp. SA_1]|uniref:pentapeptide repeat-containing protein n=1 Tax=Rheinheimera sp. SA_1 TaxID=1827365 RepID=UPI0007FFB174|nr:pentapeptide repeat-containing protein [Rheinheimera sp. SA_1]OBP16538.1 hypothetical protein A5320_03840 [Rheinheimera sp. SA_1]
MEFPKSYIKTLSIVSIIFGVVLVVVTSIFFDYDEDFWGNITVELHGALFDILIFGLLLYWLLSRNETARNDENARKKIESYLNKKNLSNLNKSDLVSQIKIAAGDAQVLTNIHFNHDLSHLSFQGLVFVECDFDSLCDLSNTDLSGAVFKSCRFLGALWPSSGPMPIMESCIFRECDLSQCSTSEDQASAFEHASFFKCNFTPELYNMLDNYDSIKEK